MKKFSAGKYEVLFDKDIAADPERGEGQVGRLNHKAVLLYRSKRVVAGDIMELMIYPVWERQREASRAKKARPTEAAQAMQNAKNARRRLTWYMNANFATDDLFLTLTYKGEQPATLEQARQDMQAYVRRVRRWREKNGLPEMKYIYAIENEEDGRKKRVHHHIVMSGMPRDEAERIWDRGRANANRLQPDDRGLEGLARYITKSQQTGRQGKRRWCGSRNLTPPKITTSERKFSRYDVERMAASEGELWERLRRREPGYQVNAVTIRRSEFVAGAYITASFRRVAPGRPERRMTDEAAEAIWPARHGRTSWRRPWRPPPC